VDLGVLWQTPESFWLPVKVSAALQNLGPPVKFIAVADPLPLTARLGFSLQPLHGERHRVLLAAEVALPPDNLAKTSVGLEYSLSRILFARLGYAFQHQENLNGPAAGIGVAFSAGAFDVRVDYTYRPQFWKGWESIANNHLLSLGVHF